MSTSANSNPCSCMLGSNLCAQIKWASLWGPVDCKNMAVQDTKIYVPRPGSIQITFAPDCMRLQAMIGHIWHPVLQIWLMFCRKKKPILRLDFEFEPVGTKATLYHPPPPFQQLKLVHCLISVTSWKRCAQLSKKSDMAMTDRYCWVMAACAWGIKLTPPCIHRLWWKWAPRWQYPYSGLWTRCIQSVHAYTTNAKNPFMPKVLASEHKQAARKAHYQVYKNTVDVTLFQTTQRGPPSQVNSLCSVWASSYRYLPAPVPRWRGSVS